jgi:hypothetical protein
VVYGTQTLCPRDRPSKHVRAGVRHSAADATAIAIEVVTRSPTHVIQCLADQAYYSSPGCFWVVTLLCFQDAQAYEVVNFRYV